MSFSIPIRLSVGLPASYAKAKYRFGRAFGVSMVSIAKEAQGSIGKVALKIVSKKNVQGQEKIIYNEIEILQRKKYPQMVKFLEYIESRDNCYIVTQWVTVGELFKIISKRDASCTIRQVVEAIDYLHDNDISYGGLTLESLNHLKSRPRSDAVLPVPEACMNQFGRSFNHPEIYQAHLDIQFLAKEVAQNPITFSCHSGSSQIMSEYPVTTSLGDQEIIWNSSASHLSPFTSCRFCKQKRVSIGQLIDLLLDHMAQQMSNFGDLFLKGWNEEWGNLRVPSSHARTGKLLDRDSVWVVTQTMVPLENLALWDVKPANYYKVYPGFWGRKSLTLAPQRGA